MELKIIFQEGAYPPNLWENGTNNVLILNCVPESVADFIQGRASITVGSIHYLAKVKQTDEWCSRVVDKIRKVIE